MTHHKTSRSYNRTSALHSRLTTAPKLLAEAVDTAELLDNVVLRRCILANDAVQWRMLAREYKSTGNLGQR